MDTWAETRWIGQGGTVWSYRVREKGDDFVVVKWEIGQGHSQIYELVMEPSWADRSSALGYRSMLVAEQADRVVAFVSKAGMRGTSFTVWVAREGEQKPTYVWSDGRWISFNGETT